MPTKAEQQLVEAMRAVIADGTWTVLPGNTVRWKSEDLLPPPNMLDRDGKIGGWPGDAVYHRLVFLSVVLGDRPRYAGSRILGIARAPWTGRQDTTVSFKRAHEVLADPAALFAPQPLHPVEVTA